MDYVQVVLVKDCFRAHQCNKLVVRKISSVEVIENINLSAYLLKLMSLINTTNVFNAEHLIRCHDKNYHEILLVIHGRVFCIMGRMMYSTKE